MRHTADNTLPDKIRAELKTVHERTMTVLTNNYANLLKPKTRAEAKDKEVLEKLLTERSKLIPDDLAEWDSRLSPVAATAMTAGVLNKDHWSEADIIRVDAFMPLAIAETSNEFAEPLRKHARQINFAVQEAVRGLDTTNFPSL